MADDDDVRRRHYDSGDGHPALTQKTKVSVDIRTLVVVVMALIAGGVSAGQYINTVAHRLTAAEVSLGRTITKGDLSTAVDQSERRIDAIIEKRTRHFLVTCSRDALRGRGDVSCTAVPIGGE